MTTPATKRSRATTANGQRDAPDAQRERRTRIMNATIALASKGGYEAVQMRAVADKADVALGTLYRYFPSKVHLLVSSLAEEFSQAHDKMHKAKIPGDTKRERLLFVVAKVTNNLQRNPQLTEAMTRAAMFADASVTAEVESVGHMMEDLFAIAYDDELTQHDRSVFRIIGDVWMSNLVAWVTHRASASDVRDRLDFAVRALIRD